MPGPTISLSSGSRTLIVDLGFIDGQPQVYGVAYSRVVDLDTVDSRAAVYGVQVLYLGTEDGTVDLGELDDVYADVFGVQFYIIPAKNWRWIQLEGGGRKLFEAVIGDESEERYFELRKNGRSFPLANVSNPIFSWRSPSGSTGEGVARIIDPLRGRVGVHLFEPNETGIWLIQVRYVDDINLDTSDREPDHTPPYAPIPGAQEFWRQLPKALRCIVRDEGGWS